MTMEQHQGSSTNPPPAAIFLLPAAMMLVALLALPYGYYQLLRLVTVVCAGWIAYAAWQDERQGWAIAFAALALLFNPMIPVHLDRETWSVINVIAAVLLVAGWWSIGRQERMRPAG